MNFSKRKSSFSVFSVFAFAILTVAAFPGLTNSIARASGAGLDVEVPFEIKALKAPGLVAPYFIQDNHGTMVVSDQAGGVFSVTFGGKATALADKSKINYPMTLLILVVMMIYVTMVYGPIAAFLVEMFPTKIRYSSMSLPYHIGNGWFGGMLPLLATALVAAKGDIYFGLWYPIVVALMSFIIGLIFLRDHKDRDIEAEYHTN